MIISFSRHKGTAYGHIIEKKRCGYRSTFRRIKVQLINERWIDENGRDVHSEATDILVASYSKALTNLESS